MVFLLEKFGECRFVTVVHLLLLGAETASSSHVGKCLLALLRNPVWPTYRVDRYLSQFLVHVVMCRAIVMCSKTAAPWLGYHGG